MKVLVNDYIPIADDQIMVEVIYEKENKYSDKMIPTNFGYVRFLSRNLRQDLKGVCVLFCDGFIRNIEREQIKIGNKFYTRLHVSDIISIFN